MAARLYEDRVAKLDGRYRANREFANLLKANPPDILRVLCERNAGVLNRELDSLYQQYWTLGDIAYRQKNFSLCAQYFRTITLLIPDPADKRFLRAQEVLHNLNSKENNG